MKILVVEYLEQFPTRFLPKRKSAETWQRLSDMQERVQPHDLLLIPHELMEMELITRGMSQEDAHIETCKEYNYPEETNLFYHRLQTERNAKIGKGDIISGGIEHKSNARDDWEFIL